MNSSVSYPKVLIFEDEFILANDLMWQLRSHNIRVSGIFRKGEEGLNYLDSLQDPSEMPDVVLMDVNLAGKLTGVEAAEVISDKFHCAVIFLTGLSHSQTIASAQHGHHWAYLTKPFEIKKTVDYIMQAVNEQRSHMDSGRVN